MLLLFSWGMTVSAAESKQILSVPVVDVTLNLAVPLPAPLAAPAQQAWQIVESESTAAPIAASVIPALTSTGTPSLQGGRLVVSVPPRKGAQNPRLFRLEPASESDTGPAFRYVDMDAKSLGLWEGDRPVLVYNYGIMSKPGAPAAFNRSSYVHPLYGLDGEVISDDFPKDHYHHRGLFWAWPHVRINGREHDLWAITNIHQRFERWLMRQTSLAAAVLGIENGWYVQDKKVMQERVWLRVYPASPEGRAIEVELAWVAMNSPITLIGAPEKSYGGLTLRFAPQKKCYITTPLGVGEEDLAMTHLPWADLSAQFEGATQPSGAAIFIAPDHPDYPPMWLTRHYGVLCVGWPGVEAKTFQPNDSIRCRYRVWVHRNVPEAGLLKKVYAAYTLAEQTKWK